MAEATEIILDPNGNRRSDGRRWMAAQRICLRALAPSEVTLVDGPQEAAQAARTAAMNGYARIVSVGDSATAHGVVNGVMELAESHRNRLKVGFLSFSRPDLWSRTLDLPRDLDRQLEILSAGHTLPYDVGRVECERDDGQAVTRHFLNAARFGFPGALRQEWRDPDTNLLQALVRMARIAGGRGGRGTRVRLEADGEVIHEGACALGLFMEGCYDPAFGRVAPQADPTDGLLDVAWMTERAGWSALLKLAGLLLGPLRASRPALHWSRAERVRVVPLDGPVTVDVDGEPAGRLPATFSVVHRALPVMVEPVAIQLRKPTFAPVHRMGRGNLVGNVKSAAGL